MTSFPERTGVLVHLLDILHVESLEEASGVPPLGGDHHVVVRLVPEVVPSSASIIHVLYLT